MGLVLGIPWEEVAGGESSRWEIVRTVARMHIWLSLVPPALQVRTKIKEAISSGHLVPIVLGVTTGFLSYCLRWDTDSLPIWIREWAGFPGWSLQAVGLDRKTETYAGTGRKGALTLESGRSLSPAENQNFQPLPFPVKAGDIEIISLLFSINV